MTQGLDTEQESIPRVIDALLGSRLRGREFLRSPLVSHNAAHAPLHGCMLTECASAGLRQPQLPCRGRRGAGMAPQLASCPCCCCALSCTHLMPSRCFAAALLGLECTRDLGAWPQVCLHHGLFFASQQQ